MRRDEAQKFARMLRKLASKLETNPDKLDFLFEPEHKRSKEPKDLLNPFEILREQGESDLRNRIEKMTIPHIKNLIQANRLDSTGLSNKWRDKKRLADFAFERLRNRYMHGDVFSEATAPGPDGPTSSTKNAG